MRLSDTEERVNEIPSDVRFLILLEVNTVFDFIIRHIYKLPEKIYGYTFLREISLKYMNKSDYCRR